MQRCRGDAAASRVSAVDHRHQAPVIHRLAHTRTAVGCHRHEACPHPPVASRVGPQPAATSECLPKRQGHGMEPVTVDGALRSQAGVVSRRRSGLQDWTTTTSNDVASSGVARRPPGRLRQPHRSSPVDSAGLGRRALPLDQLRSPGRRRFGRTGCRRRTGLRDRRRPDRSPSRRRRRREPACRATTRRGRDAAHESRAPGTAPSLAAPAPARGGAPRRRLRGVRDSDAVAVSRRPASRG